MKQVTPEELKEMQTLRDSLLEIISTAGELTLTKSLLEKELATVVNKIKTEEEKFAQYQENERVIFEKLQQKYGTGNIDLTTGEILG